MRLSIHPALCSGLAAALGYVPVPSALAAALRVVTGCGVEPKAYLDTTILTGPAESITWFVTDKVETCGTLLESLRLQRLESAHPLVAALAALRTADMLMEWLEGKSQPGCLLRQPFLMLEKNRLTDAVQSMPGGTCNIELRSAAFCRQVENAIAQKCLTPGYTGGFPVLPHHAAAAGIVCGHWPHRIYTGANGAPELLLSAASLTFPGLTWPHIDLKLRGQAIGELPGVDTPGEHPFDYAFETLRTACLLRVVEAMAAKNPTLKFKGAGTTSALVSASLMNNDQFAAATDKHLAGV